MKNIFINLFFYAFSFYNLGNTGKVTTLVNTFYGAVAFTSDLLKWDVSKVTSLRGTFYNAQAFNSDISSWDVSKITSLDSTFSRATVFNFDLSTWNVSKVITLRNTFSLAEAFNSNLSTWDVSKVSSLEGTFYYARAFNSDLSTWSVSKVITLQRTFYGAQAYNSDMSSWDVSKVTSLDYTFSNARVFNSDLSEWDISRVSSLRNTFSVATVFNSDISKWVVSRVTDLRETFKLAQNFNSDISNWDVTDKMNNLYDLFYHAYAFNQDLSLWDVSSVSNFGRCFYYAKSFQFKTALDASWQDQDSEYYPGGFMYTASCALDTSCGFCGKQSTNLNSAVTCSANVQPAKDPLKPCLLCANDGAECCNVALQCPAGKYEYVPLSASRECRNMTNNTCGIGKRFESASATDSLFRGATTDDGTCIPCRPGKFKSTISPTSCTVCAPGSYQNLPGSGLCTLCPAGKKLPTHGTYEEHDSLNDCEDCAILQFSPFEGQTEECYPCMTARTTGSIDCAGCNPGTYKNNTGDCVQCPSGYFTSKQNLRRCDDCPLGYFANQLPSLDGTIRYDRCQACQRGQHGTIPKAKNEQEGCNNCASGKYSDVEGLKFPIGCKRCPKGKWRLLLLVF